MEEVKEQRDVATPNFEALMQDQTFGEPTEKVEVKEEVKVEEIKDETPVIEEVKEEVKTDEKKEEVKDEKAEVKDEKADVKEEVLEFKAEDVAGFEKEPEDGTYAALAKGMEVEVADESFDSFKAAVEAKYNAKIEEAKKQSTESVFATLKPETVAALKLIEMGVPEADVFAPTKQIDQWLSLDDMALVREDIRLAHKDWDDAKIDTEMEIITEKGWSKHLADSIREGLNNDKKAIADNRETLLQQYTENKNKVAIQQKEQERTQFKQALDTVPDFMGAKLSKEVKDVIEIKLNRGDYDNILNDPKSKLNLILYTELGEKARKRIEDTAFNKGRDTIAKNLMKIPPVEGHIAKKVVETNQISGPLAAFKDFE